MKKAPKQTKTASTMKQPTPMSPMSPAPMASKGGKVSTMKKTGKKK